MSEKEYETVETKRQAVCTLIVLLIQLPIAIVLISLKDLKCCIDARLMRWANSHFRSREQARERGW